MAELIKRTGFSKEAVREFFLRFHYSSPVSIHKINDDDNGECNNALNQISIIASSIGEEEWKEWIEYEIMLERLKYILEKTWLNERQKAVIMHRFGLDWFQYLSFEEIWKIYTISKTRTQQIFQEAMKKLKYQKDFISGTDNVLKEIVPTKRGRKKKQKPVAIV